MTIKKARTDLKKIKKYSDAILEQIYYCEENPHILTTSDLEYWANRIVLKMLKDKL